MSLMRTTFSWLRCRNSFTSLSVRFASMTFSKAFVIFLMATVSSSSILRAELHTKRMWCTAQAA